MRREDIIPGQHYAAKVRWNTSVPVEVLEVGVERLRYGNRVRKDGVRVRTLESFKDYSRDCPAGEVFLITSRDVNHGWTPEHQARRDHLRAQQAEADALAGRVREALIERGVDARVSPQGVTLSLEAATTLLGLEVAA